VELCVGDLLSSIAHGHEAPPDIDFGQAEPDVMEVSRVSGNGGARVANLTILLLSMFGKAEAARNNNSVFIAQHPNFQSVVSFGILYTTRPSRSPLAGKVSGKVLFHCKGIYTCFSQGE